MSDANLGKITWCDLTVPDAKAVADFYAAVTGWTPQGLSMGDYEDFVMLAPGGDGAAGICTPAARTPACPPSGWSTLRWPTWTPRPSAAGKPGAPCSTARATRAAGASP